MPPSNSTKPEYFDKRGVPVMVADLLKTYHFRERGGRVHYQYHVVTEKDGAWYVTPTAWLVPSRVNHGGQCLLRLIADERNVLTNSEIISGGSLEGPVCFTDRRRRKDLIAPLANPKESTNAK